MLHGFDLLYVLSGFCVGALVGMTGVGGGSLMTPVLILLFGIHPSTAVGTDLLYAAVTKTGGIAIHTLHRTIDWKVVGRLATGSVPAALLTILALSRFDLGSGSARTLINDVLGVALLLTAFVLVFRQRILAVYASRVGRLNDRTNRLLTVIFGALLGVLVSISSVGAGAIGVTALLLLYPDLPMRRIVGSDIAHAVPLTLVGGVGHAILGSTNWPVLLALLIGSIPGVLLGGQVAVKVPETVLRLALATILLVVVSRLVL